MKYFVKKFSHSRSPTDNHVVIVVEYMALSGPAKSGKLQLDVAASGGFRHNLRQAVAASLGVQAGQIIGLE